MKTNDSFDIAELQEKFFDGRNLFSLQTGQQYSRRVSAEKSRHPRVDLLVCEIPLPDHLEFDYIKINQKENGKTLIILLADSQKREKALETEESHQEMSLAFHSFLL